MNRESLLRNPNGQIILALLLVLGTYVIFAGRSGEARDVIPQGTTAFVPVGRTGGVRILQVQTEVINEGTQSYKLVDRGGYDTRGTAEGIAIDIREETTVDGPKNTMYGIVADGGKGIRMVDFTDVDNPRDFVRRDTPGYANDVVVISRDDIQPGNRYAYVADGPNGLRVYNITNPNDPRAIYEQTIGDQGNRGVGDAIDVAAFGTLVAVADGPGGLRLFNASTPNLPAELRRFETRDYTYAVDFTTTDRGTLLVVADGIAGVRIFNVTDVNNIIELGTTNTNGIAYDIDTQNQFAYVANGTAGLSVMNVNRVGEPPLNNITINTNQFGNTEVVGVGVSDNLLYLATGENGLAVLSITEPRSPALIGKWETPGEANLMEMIYSVALYLYPSYRDRITQQMVTTWRNLVVDVLFLGLFGFAAWLFFFTQFTLPVKTLVERVNAYTRVLMYPNFGPAIFIENGNLRISEGEDEKKSPGVILLDTASAAVMKRSNMLTRPIGPGIAFTKRNEKVAGVVSLQRQFSNLGPRYGEDPFAPQDENELPEEYQLRQERKQQATARTRDGIEVVARITAMFKLEGNPGEGDSYYGYNAKAVGDAIFHKGIDPSVPADTRQRDRTWDWLPAQLIVNLWREYLHKFTLNELFIYPQDPESDEPVIKHIREAIRDRLTHPEGAKEIDEKGIIGERPGEPSREYKLLKDRGIHVIAANVQALRFPPHIEEQLIEEWVPKWKKEANVRSIRTRISVAQTQAQALENGKALFVLEASKLLANALDEAKKQGDDPPELSDSLEKVLAGTLNQCMTNEFVYMNLVDEQQNLQSLINWVRRQA
jgi:hypothetical protein